MWVIRAGGFSVVSLPGSSQLHFSFTRLRRFLSALKLLNNRQARQATRSVVGRPLSISITFTSFLRHVILPCRDSVSFGDDVVRKRDFHVIF